MATSRIYVCAIDESRQEVETDESGKPLYPEHLTFSVYKLPSGRTISICPNCKSIIEFVCQEVINKQKKGK